MPKKYDIEAFRKVVKKMTSSSKILNEIDASDFLELCDELGFNELKGMFNMLIKTQKELTTIMSKLQKEFPEVYKQIKT